MKATTYPGSSTMKTNAYPSGLRYLFVLGTVGSFITGFPAVFFPSVIVALSGLSPEAIPAMQQSGALALGSTAAGLLCLRAVNWNEVRITVVGSFVTFLLTTIGAFYYVVLQGVATPGLILILIIGIVMTLGFGYYLAQYMQRGEVMS
jgi:hypothetical protein